MMLVKTAAQSRAVRPGDGMPSSAPAVSFMYSTFMYNRRFVHMSPSCRHGQWQLDNQSAHVLPPEGVRAGQKNPQDRLGAGIQFNPTPKVSVAMDDRHRGIKVPFDTSPMPAQATP